MILARTNCANDRSSTHHLLGLVFGVEVALPFQLGAVVEVSQCVRHVDDSSRPCGLGDGR